MKSSAEQFNELQDLRFHWEEAYSLNLEGGEFVAARLDNQRQLKAGTAEELRELIVTDYAANPVPRAPGNEAGDE